MKAILVAVALLASVVSLEAAPAEDQPYYVVYVTGRDGVKAFRGEMALNATAIVVMDITRGRKKQTLALTIPFETIVSAVGTTEHESGSFRGTEDYVTITTETAERAEALVFRVKRKQGAGLAAQITFTAKRAAATTAVTSR